MNGMELARDLYESRLRPAIAEQFPEEQARIAVGLAGPGSECFGFDDAISRDHDFAPRACLWLTDEDDARFGARLQTLYASIAPQSGIAPQARDRSGVMRISAFYARFTGCPGVPQTPIGWLCIPEHLLAAATNGSVFRDDLGAFSAIRSGLLRGYPEDVFRKRLAARLFAAGQAGQYNLPRCRDRSDPVAASFCLTAFAQASLQIVFLLNRRYAPYDKWLFRAACALPACRDAVSDVRRLISCLRDEQPELIERIAFRITEELRRQQLSSESNPFLVAQAAAVSAGIQSPELRALELSVG